MKVVDLAPIERRQKWLDAAGLAAPGEKRKANAALIRKVPILKDAAALGTLRASHAKEIERIWEVPKDWLPAEGILQAIRAPADGAMRPLIEKGYIVVVNVERRDPKVLVNTLVVVRNKEGVCIRWLRRDMGLDLLMPLDLRHHTMSALDAKEGSSLVGEVVLWVGKPLEQ